MSTSSRRKKLERRRAAQLHPMSESLEAAFEAIERPALARTEAAASRSTLTQDGRSNA